MSWKSVPLRALYRRRVERGKPEAELLSVYRDLGVVQRGEREDNYNRPSDDLSSYLVVRPRDLVLNKMKTWQGSLGVSPFAGIVSPAYFVAEQVHDAHPRFLHHLLRSQPLIAEYRARSKGIRPAQWDLPWDEFAAIRIRIPAKEVQRAIADFLDAETARIDRLIAKKCQMIGLLEERRSGLIESAIREVVTTHGEARLRFLANQVTVGIVVRPSLWYADEGVPALRGVNVLPGHVDLGNLVYLTKEGHELHRKSKLRTGDLVVVRTGQAGSAAIVPKELDGANCIDLIIIRPGNRLDSKFLEYVLNSDWTQKHVDQHAVGSIQHHFNVGAMNSLPIPKAPLDMQKVVVNQLDVNTSWIDSTVNCLQRQVTLLQGHREALITAAVTGQLDVHGMAA